MVDVVSQFRGGLYARPRRDLSKGFFGLKREPPLAMQPKRDCQGDQRGRIPAVSRVGEGQFGEEELAVNHDSFPVRAASRRDLIL